MHIALKVLCFSTASQIIPEFCAELVDKQQLIAGREGFESNNQRRDTAQRL